MFCGNCGEDVPQTAAFCAKCGTQVAPSQIGAPPPSGNLPAEYVAPAVPYPQGQIAQPQDDSKAILSMILGILSLLGLSILAGIPAIILGHITRKSMRASGQTSGKGMATAGMIMGWISCGVFVVVVALLIIVVLAASEWH